MKKLLLCLVFVVIAATGFGQTTARNNTTGQPKECGIKTQDTGLEATLSKTGNCPLIGTPDCPLVKNCAKKGQPDCPYKNASGGSSASVKNPDSDKPGCSKNANASCCARK